MAPGEAELRLRERLGRLRSLPLLGRTGLSGERVRLAVLATLIELVIAFALSVVFGMLIGILVGLSNLGRRLADKRWDQGAAALVALTPREG